MKLIERVLRMFAPARPVPLARPITFSARRKPPRCTPAPSYADAVEEIRREQEIEAELRAQGEPSAAARRIAREIAALERRRPTTFSRKLRLVK